jgi:hypothetical protein
MEKKKILAAVAILFVANSAFGQGTYTAHLISLPLGATIYKTGQVKALGQTPLRIEIPQSAFDAKSLTLQGIEFEARWRSGALSRTSRFGGLASPVELIFILERPDTVPGLEKDKAVGQKRQANPQVAAELQILLAKANKVQSDIAAATKARTEQIAKQRELDAIESARAAQQQAQREQEAAYALEMQRRQAAAARLAEIENGRRMSNQMINMGSHLLRNNGNW